MRKLAALVLLAPLTGSLQGCTQDLLPPVPAPRPVRVEVVPEFEVEVSFNKTLKPEVWTESNVPVTYFINGKPARQGKLTDEGKTHYWVILHDDFMKFDEPLASRFATNSVRVTRLLSEAFIEPQRLEVKIGGETVKELEIEVRPYHSIWAPREEEGIRRYIPVRIRSFDSHYRDALDPVIHALSQINDKAYLRTPHKIGLLPNPSTFDFPIKELDIGYETSMRSGVLKLHWKFFEPNPSYWFREKQKAVQNAPPTQRRLANEIISQVIYTLYRTYSPPRRLGSQR